MKLTSIKDYLGLDPKSNDLRLVKLLLAAVRLNAIRVSTDEYELFRSDLESIESELNTADSDRSYMISGKAVRCIEQYGRTSDRLLQQQTKQIRGVVSMLTETVAMLSSCDQGSRTRLKDVEKQLEGAMDAGDLSEAKARLGVCLEAVRSEATLRHAESQKTLASIQEQLRVAEGFQRQADAGLQGGATRAQAEKAIEQNLNHPTSKLVLFRLNTLDLIRKRFGQEVAESVMVAFARHLKSFEERGHRIFTWSSNCLASLVDADEIGGLRRELASPNFTRFEVQVDRGGPSAYVASQISSVIVPLRAENDSSRLFQRIDHFSGFGSFPAPAEMPGARSGTFAPKQ